MHDVAGTAPSRTSTGDAPVTGEPTPGRSASADDPLEVLYRSQYAPSVRLAHLLIGDRSRAEELAQDAFVRIAPVLGTVDNPAGYLRTTVVNLCRDAGRRATRARALPVPTEGVSPPPPLPESSTAVWAALQSLPQRQRAAVSLRYYLDLPTDEIAEILGARPATVRSLVHRALATLKELVPHE